VENLIHALHSHLRCLVESQSMGPGSLPLRTSLAVLLRERLRGRAPGNWKLAKEWVPASAARIAEAMGDPSRSLIRCLRSR